MLIRLIESVAVPGGKAFALCDDDGAPLPGQRGTVVETSIGEVPTVTVTFAVDGDAIRFED